MQVLCTHEWFKGNMTEKKKKKGLTRAGEPFSARAEFDRGDSFSVAG